jgi:mannose-6-phosphate isomerase-like protein (cupin superfamily)
VTENTNLATQELASTGYAVARKSDPNFIKGRRDYFKYVDLGVTDASQGRMRVQRTSTTDGMSEETGWHYHKCEGQFVFMLEGWLELQFADGETVILEEGDSVYIDGYAPHNETRTSDTFELLEFSVPADMGTEECESPTKSSS